MNLIEQLGGYERAKDGLHRLKLEKKDLLTCGDLVVVESEIDAALIEYRRQHNIYEIGDKIVSTLDGSEDWKNAICEILAFHKKMAITTGFSCAIHHYDYRHATDLEIKAGRRL